MKECAFVQDDQGNQVGQPRPTLIGLLELKMENCPNIQALPRIFAPQKLEIRGCALITILPVAQFAQRLQHLALETCSNETLVRGIPSTNSLYSLVISNISNLTSFPKLPHLPGLKSLHISDCNDLTSLSEEEGSLKSLSSLKLLSIRGCPKLESLPDEGLPTALECLVIGSCPILKSLTDLKEPSLTQGLIFGGLSLDLVLPRGWTTFLSPTFGDSWMSPADRAMPKGGCRRYRMAKDHACYRPGN